MTFGAQLNAEYLLTFLYSQGRLRDFWDARVMAPGSIPGLPTVQVWGRGCLDSCVQLLPVVPASGLHLPARLLVLLWLRPSDPTGSLSQLAALYLMALLSSSSKAPPLSSLCLSPGSSSLPTFSASLWLKALQCAIMVPHKVPLKVWLSEELAHPLQLSVTGTPEAVEQRGWERALKSGFLVQILVASYHLCNSSHIFSIPQLIVLGQSENLLNNNASNKMLSPAFCPSWLFLVFWLLRVNNSSSVCFPAAAFASSLSTSTPQLTSPAEQWFFLRPLTKAAAVFGAMTYHTVSLRWRHVGCINFLLLL